jgi:hypothetical protein
MLVHTFEQHHMNCQHACMWLFVSVALQKRKKGPNSMVYNVYASRDPRLLKCWESWLREEKQVRTTRALPRW